jgi:hypothetical protein
VKVTAFLFWAGLGNRHWLPVKPLFDRPASTASPGIVQICP